MPRVIIRTIGGTKVVNNLAIKPPKRATMTQVNKYFQTKTYEFDFAPVVVDYSDVAAEYAEIERPGRYPLIGYRAPRLLKASFNFVIANPKTGGCSSIEQKLDQLRRMAADDGIVFFSNMDRFLLRPAWKLSKSEHQGRNVAFWRITDLSIGIVHRNLQNQALQAEASITVTEFLNELIPVETLPAITYPDETPKTSTGTRTGTGSSNPTPPEPSPDTDSGITFSEGATSGP